MERENSSAPVVMVGFLLIGLLIGISLFIIFRNSSPRIKAIDASQKNITLENKTNLVYTVVLPSSQHIDVSPEQKIQIALGVGDIITASAYNYDKSLSKYTYRLSNNHVTNLYIGNSSILSNLDSNTNTTFVNNSPYPVMFVEKSSKGGKRWASDIVPPREKISGRFVSKRSTWQVVHPTDEDTPITEITIGSIPKNIIFNGKVLKSL